MYYEINVSLNGNHFFATAERSATTEYEARRLFTEIKNRFRKEDGYNVTCTLWDKFGTNQRF